jgi:hypothetical protein
MIKKESGRAPRLDDMYAFHSRHGITAQRGQSRRKGEQYYISWCFADPAIADAFAGEFGA